LKACQSLSKAARNILVLYGKGLARKLDLLYDNGHGTLKFHRRWLDFYAMRQEASCRERFLDTMTEKKCAISLQSRCRGALVPVHFFDFQSILDAADDSDKIHASG
jgi:hypothetical protein